jgi:hypothetical protein
MGTVTDPRDFETRVVFVLRVVALISQRQHRRSNKHCSLDRYLDSSLMLLLLLSLSCLRCSKKHSMSSRLVIRMADDPADHDASFAVKLVVVPARIKVVVNGLPATIHKLVLQKNLKARTAERIDKLPARSES